MKIVLICFIALFLCSTSVLADQTVTPKEESQEQILNDINEHFYDDFIDLILPCLQLPHEFLYECVRDIFGDETYQNYMCLNAGARLLDAVVNYQSGPLTPELIQLVQQYMRYCPAGDGMKCFMLTILAHHIMGTPLGDYLNIKSGQVCGMTAYGFETSFK